MALYSTLTDKVIDDKLIAMGEIGLAGELRGITDCRRRLSECERMGFEKCIVPAQSVRGLDLSSFNMQVIPVRSIKQALSNIN